MSFACWGAASLVCWSTASLSCWGAVSFVCWGAVSLVCWGATSLVCWGVSLVPALLCASACGGPMCGDAAPVAEPFATATSTVSDVSEACAALDAAVSSRGGGAEGVMSDATMVPLPRTSPPELSESPSSTGEPCWLSLTTPAPGLPISTPGADSSPSLRARASLCVAASRTVTGEPGDASERRASPCALSRDPGSARDRS